MQFRNICGQIYQMGFMHVQFQLFKSQFHDNSIDTTTDRLTVHVYTITKSYYYYYYQFHQRQGVLLVSSLSQPYLMSMDAWVVFKRFCLADR